MLEEFVDIAWDNSKFQRASFHNVLNIVTYSDERQGKADVHYNLCRSVSSSFLWDSGPGGLRLDQGFVKLRRLGSGDIWRLTVRKEVQFDNRPAGYGGPWDLNRLMNSLAPAALAFWLDSGLYNLADKSADQLRA